MLSTDPNYIYIYVGFATIDPLIFMKVYFSNQHLFTWTKRPCFCFLGKLKLKGINVIVIYSFFFNENTKDPPPSLSFFSSLLVSLSPHHFSEFTLPASPRVVSTIRNTTFFLFSCVVVCHHT